MKFVVTMRPLKLDLKWARTHTCFTDNSITCPDLSHKVISSRLLYDLILASVTCSKFSSTTNDSNSSNSIETLHSSLRARHSQRLHCKTARQF